MHVSGLFIYPVKSLRGYAVSTATVDALGFAGDRRFLVIDEAGIFVTQRSVPRLALVATTLTGDSLGLSAAGAGSIAVPLRPTAPGAPRTVSVWRSHGLAVEDCGEAVASWLSAVTGAGCRLVRMAPTFRRPVLQKPRFAAGVTPASPELVEGRIVTSDAFNFADGYPFMAVGEASLANLNDRLIAQGEEPVPMDRFRPNIVITDSEPFAEDTWGRVRIGPIEFRSGGPCARCIVTTTDQQTGQRGVEPLRTLAEYRRDSVEPSNVNFGENLIHEAKTGTLRVGDRVEVLVQRP